MRIGRASLVVACSWLVACNYVIGYDKLVKVNRPVVLLPDGAVAITATQVAVGAKHTCATYSDRLLRCWGNNEFGQIGVEGASSVLVPTVVPDITDVASIALGEHHTCATRESGETRCWGANVEEGESASETRIEHDGFTMLVTNADHACGIREGRVYCYGHNDSGQLGLGHVMDTSTPTEPAL